MGEEDAVTVESAGEYLNIKHEGNLRVSISEEFNEVLVYENGVDEPRARFELEEGVPMD